MSLKSQFLKLYADLPLGARSEIVGVIDNEPITWNSARVEVENDTAISKKILTQLVYIGVLNENDDK